MAEKLPHVVLILADDLGYGDLSCLNPESKIPTPHHDALAKRGVTFTDAHSNSAVCTPTRYGVLTGRHCWRTWLKRSVLNGYSVSLLEPDRLTVPEMMRRQGYATACIGKWHLGLDWQTRPDAPGPEGLRRELDPDAIDFDRPPAAGPHTAGFDYSYIIPASLDMTPYCYLENGQVTEKPTGHIETSGRPFYWRGGQIAPGFEHETCLLEFTRRTEKHIADHAATRAEQPMFLYVPLPSPHTPHTPRKPFRGKSEAGTYGDYVVEHDWSVGRIVAALERADMLDDTLLIVTSDNGAHCASNPNSDDAFHFEQQFGHRSSYIYRGQKSDAWDGGHRIPMLVRWPGAVEAGSTCRQTICLTDIMATLAELTGYDLPEDAAEDSVSFLPLLHGQDAKTREATIHHSLHGEFAIRRGRWKYIECAGSGGWSLPENEVPEDAPSRQLYDMQSDPSEKVNVVAEHPEIAGELQALLDASRRADRTAALES